MKLATQDLGLLDSSATDCLLLLLLMGPNKLLVSVAYHNTPCLKKWVTFIFTITLAKVEQISYFDC